MKPEITSAAATLVAIFLSLAAPVQAGSLASDDDDDDEVELEPDAARGGDTSGDEGSPEGSQEDPNFVPEFGSTRTPEKGPAAKDARPPGYPREVVYRPLLLYKGMSQVSFDLLTNVDTAFAAGLLEARYSVTPEVEIGVGYGVGAVDGDGYTSGKAVSIAGQYLVRSFIAAQMEIPFYIDPFAMGVTFGVPMKFRFGDKLALVFGQDLVNIKITGFFPSTGDPLGNEALAGASEINSVIPDGELRFLLDVVYQYSDKLALIGQTGFLARDLGTTDAGYPLLVTASYTSSDRFDVGVRVGFRTLDDAGGTFGATFLLAVRI